ncbi:MAG: DUF3187 family protein [Spirochaetes bacterium]|nr:DUF3187 family protein [Spirochaetota bacterium]
MFLPYMIYLTFPGVRAKTERQFQLQYHTSFYFINDFYIPYGKLTYDNTKSYYKSVRAYDYESLNFEFGISFSPLKNLQVGMHTRVVGYYSGFLDAIVQNFHDLFGFPNAGRDEFSQNDTYIDIKNSSGVRLKLKNYAFSFGDIDTWIKYTFYQKKWIALAVINGYKIPTGSVKYISGSGYPDIGIGLLMDLMPIRFISIYLQTNFILPFDAVIPQAPSKPYPMFQGMLNLSVNPVRYLSILVQLNFKTPVLKTQYDLDESFNGIHELYYPQTDILVGLIFEIMNIKFQFYFEQNPIYTAGADIVFNFLLAHKINIKKD